MPSLSASIVGSVRGAYSLRAVMTTFAVHREIGADNHHAETL